VADEASARRSPWRRRVLVAVPAVALLAGLSVFGVGCLRDHREEERCRKLGARVEGIDGFEWANGFTASGSEWSSVLTDGVQQADAESRAELAEAVAADEDGFRSWSAALPSDAEAAAGRLRELVLQPDEAAERAHGPDVDAAVTTVWRESRDCGYV
jgi:hypothetical protein